MLKDRKETMNRELTALPAILLIALAMVLSLCACGKGGSVAASRNISVTDINGTAEVTTSGKSMNAFKGQKLVSGDAVDVHADSDMTLLLDEDKHVFASENSHFSLESTGEIGATKTRIIVDNGTTLIGIDNKLGEEETFEVATPNAVMAVRGTVFYVTVNKTDIDTGVKTELVVKEGIVEAVTVENGEVRKDIVSEGQTSAYFGTAPTDNQAGAASEAETAAYETISPDKIGEGQTEATKNRENGIDLDQYFADMGVEGVAVTGKAYYFDDYYKDNPTYLKLQSEMKVWSTAKDILVLSEPVTYDGQTISVCVIGGCDVLYDNMQERAFEAGENNFYGFFEPYKSGNSNPNQDVTERVVGSPLYIYYVADIR